MTFFPILYCQHCGAANANQAIRCFACEKTLQVQERECWLKQRYRLLAAVGQGGFGIVYKAEDTRCGNRLVAIKAIHLGSLNEQEALEANDAFNREVSLLADLCHPHLPRLYDYFNSAAYSFLVRDFIEGETLEQYLDKTRDGTLPWQEVLALALQLCTVLNYLHTHAPPIIYRDLKPANIMLTSTGHLYLIDFGIARYFKAGQVKDTMALGSPGYAAPEQYGSAQTTPRADIYSLGALLYHLLTGNDPAVTPFRFEAFSLQMQALPARFRTLLSHMTAIDANSRPANIAVVKQELAEISTVTLPTGSTISTYSEHGGLILAAAWSPDGTSIVSCSSDGSLHIWDAASGRNRCIYRNPAKWYTWSCSLAWSVDGTLIAFGSDDKTVQLWQVEKTGLTAMALRPYSTYTGHTSWVNAVAWSPDSSRIVSASDDTTVHIWQVDRNAAHNLFEMYRGHTRWVATAAWSPDGTTIASGGNDGAIHIWDAVTKHTLLIYRGHAFGVNALAWSPDGRRIASCCWDNTVHIWDATTGATLRVYRCHTSDVFTLAWSPDGARIASAGKDRAVHIWDVITAHTVFTYTGHARWVYTLAWSPDGMRMASGGSDKTVQVWQAGGSFAE